MSDRKYRQRGYMDSGEDRGEKRSRQPKPEPVPRELRKPNMPGFKEVVRCARCGHVLSPEIQADSRCSHCGTDLHTCAQCVSFDAGRRFECAQSIPARVTPKDARNSCSLFEPRVTIERETRSARVPSARQAFDDLFK